MRTYTTPRRFPAPRSGVLNSAELKRYDFARAIAAASERAAGRSWAPSFETEVSATLQADSDYAGAGAGLAVPLECFAGVDTITGPTGGYTTTPGIPGPYSAALARSLAARLEVEWFLDLKGKNELTLPAGDATPDLGWINPNGDGEAAAGTLNTKVLALAPRSCGTYFDISRAQLKNDAAVLDKVVKAEAINAVGAAIDYALLAGTGGIVEPFGLLHRPDVELVAIGDNGGALTRDVLKRMLAAVGAASVVDGLALVTGNAVRSAALMTPNDAGAGGGFLWQAPLGGADGSVLESVPAWVSPAVPEDLSKGSGTNLSAAVLGRWSDAAVGVWGRSVELLIDKLYPSGGVRVVVILDVDAGPRHSGSFARCVDIVTA